MCVCRSFIFASTPYQLANEKTTLIGAKTNDYYIIGISGGAKTETLAKVATLGFERIPK